MNGYKLKHIPTGLYYDSVRYVKVEGCNKQFKSNLSEHGKIFYHKINKLKLKPSPIHLDIPIDLLEFKLEIVK